MDTVSKKETFKLLIKEFHTEPLPLALARDLAVPLFPKKVITVFGPRRSGKSFYFFSLIGQLLHQGVSVERVVYVNFEDDRLLPLEVADLNALLEAFFELYPEQHGQEIFFFFDEIQNITNWELFVRRVYEKLKARVFITGSSSKLLSKEIATSLRGRTLSYALSPLCFKEFLRFREEPASRDIAYTSQRFRMKKLLGEYIEWGGFPEVVLEENRTLKKKILADYFEALVYRDLAERFSLQNIDLLKDLLKFLLTNITTLFSVNAYFNTIKQKMSVSRETVSSYLSYIAEGRYFFLLPLFAYSLKVQRVNPKKVIAIDTGLRNATAFRFSEDKGKLVENVVGATLATRTEEIFYWKGKGEVDFVVKDGAALIAINVSLSDPLKEREVASLLEFKHHHKRVKELLLITRDNEKKEHGINYVPLWKWLLQEV